MFTAMGSLLISLALRCLPLCNQIREVIAAAESIDAKIAKLSPVLAEALLNTSPFWGRRRQWALDRSIHRHEHLDAIERAVNR